MRPRPAPARTGREQHRAWLQLVDTDGPFLAVPALARLRSSGMPPIEDAAKAALVAAKPSFEQAWDRWDLSPDPESAVSGFAITRDAWVDVVLREVFGWGDLWQPADPVLARLHHQR